MESNLYCNEKLSTSNSKVTQTSWLHWEQRVVGHLINYPLNDGKIFLNKDTFVVWIIIPLASSQIDNYYIRQLIFGFRFEGILINCFKTYASIIPTSSTCKEKSHLLHLYLFFFFFKLLSLEVRTISWQFWLFFIILGWYLINQCLKILTWINQWFRKTERR